MKQSKNKIFKIIKILFSFSLIKSLFFSFGYYLYEHVLWRKYINLKGKSRIHSTASIRNPKNVFVGENSHINHNCCVWADNQSKIILGDNLLMGPGVKIFSANHGHELGIPMTYQKRVEADVIIGDNVWLGSNTIILSGVKIGSGTIVAAGSVVSKDLPENVIAGGIPAKIIKKRD